jgi:hypothetical protein
MTSARDLAVEPARLPVLDQEPQQVSSIVLFLLHVAVEVR